MLAYLKLRRNVLKGIFKVSDEKNRRYLKEIRCEFDSFLCVLALLV